MKVEIWSDLICPWCGLGQHRLDQALAAFEHRDQVEVVHRSFQLDPSAPPGTRPVLEMLLAKGVPASQLRSMVGRIEALAESDGLRPYVVGDNVVGNTRLAHELLALASERGVEDQAWKLLYRAYFGERRSIFDVESLVALGQELGLDPAEVRTALGDGRYRARVEEDAREARSLGSSGVPFVVVDRRYGVSGAQPTATFLGALEQAWRALRPDPRAEPSGAHPRAEALCQEPPLGVSSPR